MPDDRQQLRASYDRLAAQYAERFDDELDHKPLERQLLTRFADSVRGHGPVCDLGCGPGQITRFLHDLGLEVFGLDLSPAMIAQARRLNPRIDFRQGDIFALGETPGSLAGITACYSLIHTPRDQLTTVLGELRRVLQPGGKLLLSIHLGSETIHLNEVWDQPVDVDFVLFEREEMERYLRAAELELEDVIEREPYPEIEIQTRRAVFFATRPGGRPRDPGAPPD
jgi:SAM-dependent methyltransferase